MATIDATPTWRGLLPLLVEVAVTGDSVGGRKGAMNELLRLADIADNLIVSNKASRAEGERMAEQNPQLDPATARLIGRVWGDVLSRLTDSGYRPAAGRDRAAADRIFKDAIGDYLAHWEPVEGEEKQEPQ
jgi:hypothetical protein